ncbi:MAG: TRAP transporter substrate-binding protein DctP [Pseudaminobacter sp.]
MFAMKSFARGCSALALGFTLFGSAVAYAQDTVTLKMVGAWAPSVSPMAETGHHFMKAVERLSEGQIKIQYMGAEDVLPPFDQPEALVNGVFDVWYGAPNYWAGIIPGGYVTELSQHPVPDNGPGSELFDFMVKMYAEHGVRYLGHYTGKPGVGSHFLISQKEIKGIEDIEGIKLRVPPLTRYFVQGVKAESITLPPSEIFLAMDRGTVDGFTWPISDGFTNYGWQSVSKYLIDQPMYRSGTGIEMNLAKWDSLSAEHQEIILKAVAETQAWTHDWLDQNQSEHLAKMKEAGMQVVEIADDKKDAWRDVAQESLWTYLQSVMPAEQFSEAERLLERKK